MKKQEIFNIFAQNKSNRIIEGESSGILNWDDIRLPQMYKLYRVLIGNHWIPSEIPMNVDKSDFPMLPTNTQNTFKRIIGLLAVLDSMQTMFVGDVREYLTDSSLEAVAAIIGQQEVIHNQSYSYVLSSLVSYTEQLEIFEYWKNDPILLKRNLFIRDAYQAFRESPSPETFFKALVADMVLEGIFFYAAFAFFYNLARDQKMLATSQMISYIQRDENQHCYFFAELYKQLLIDFPQLNTEQNKTFVYNFMDEAVRHETEWAEYVLDGIEGIDLDEFRGYIRHIANNRLRLMGLPAAYEGVSNTMPWIRPFSDEALNDTLTDQFEAKPRTYTKASQDNDWDDL
ncbi:ribonucleotide-diphosphate reductase subunit beta [Paenibacillus polymyxa]|uniref:Ribonucleoside-diphosphate reductase subunit beta n=1 Tax=Paenibacillus polymyxa (strain SC2) TaxID=886882 RepID=E3EKN4_PAEPS|nr:ribonucleotide-diphosphate reductase subunit beta [Paenibacillus polymyxa]ADO59485.1 ribonucleotide-diphosphate reductase subunit beta [Paenibacillus polymyxa SC2]WPQ59677.1 ribonucleotide-diphosphate reductase subunit beta [Paenibacillus polymyxa]